VKFIVQVEHPALSALGRAYLQGGAAVDEVNLAPLEPKDFLFPPAAVIGHCDHGLKLSRQGVPQGQEFLSGFLSLGLFRIMNPLLLSS
jgi:hypothetical protein